MLFSILQNSEVRMLDYQVKLLSNPWDHTVPHAKLYDLLVQVAESRANHIEKMHAKDEWPRASLGLALMIPGAPRNWMAEDAILATIAIGMEGQRFVVNAISKAFYHHDHGVPAGYGRYVDLAASADGDFCYGYSAKVDNMIAGASAQTEIQDACEAAHAAATFLYFIRRERGVWIDQQPEPPHWFCNVDEPGELYKLVADREPIYTPS
jgi:hypothetical protein